MLVAGVVQTWFTQVLFADGSYFLVRISDSRWFVLDSGRQIGNVLTQFPTVFAIRLFGIHSYHALAILLGVGFFVLPTALCAVALWIARRDIVVFWFVAIATSALLLLGFGDLGAQFATHVFILMASILMVRTQLRRWHIGILLALGIVTFASYQSFVLLAPALLAMLVFRQRRGQFPMHKYSALFLAIELICSLAYNVYLLVSGHVTGSTNTLIAGATNWNFFTSEEHVRIIFLLAVILGVPLVITALSNMVAKRLSSLVSTILSISLAVVSLILIASANLWLEPRASFHLRGLIAGSVGVLGIAAIFMIGRRSSPKDTSWRIAPVVALIVVASLNACFVATKWHDYQQQFQTSMRTYESWVPVQQLSINESLVHNFNWSWTSDSLGIVLNSVPGRVGVRNAPGKDHSYSELLRAINNYSAHPSLSTLPATLRRYRW